MRDEIVLETPAQIHALAHPLRQRVLNLLTDASYTNKQLASVLNVSPPRLHFHMRELQGAGLIEIVAEQPKGGVIEKYYRAVARVISLSDRVKPIAEDEKLLEKTLNVIRKEYTRARTYFGMQPPDTLFGYEPLRLSTARLALIREHLQAIHKEMYEALEDPERESYEHVVSLSYLLHALPPVPDETAQHEEGTDETARG